MVEVKLHGTWGSPFSCRVIWCLKMKGIPYEYIEEDLSNKSPLLLHYNPVHKRIPVLVHGGKPICESMVILEYIEETWPQNPSLLLPTDDPFERAVARHWIKFAEEKLGPAIWMMFRSGGEEHEKWKKESLEVLKTIEEMALGDEKKFFGGEKISLVDIAFGSHVHWLQGVIEEVTGAKLIEAHKFPRLHAWIHNFKQVAVIKENLPDPDQMVLTFKGIRERLLASS